MSDIIKSNNEFLHEHTNNIGNVLTSIDESILSCNESYSSTTKCPPEEVPVVDTFLHASNELFKKIQDEINLINSIGDGISELDNVMEGKATELDIKLSSVKAGEVKPKEFEKIDTPSVSSVDKQIEEIADNEGVDLSDLDMPHENYEYGKVTPKGGNSGGSSGTFGNINGNDDNNTDNDNDKELFKEHSDNIFEDYNNFRNEDNEEEDTSPKLVDGVYRTIVPETNKKEKSKEKETINDIDPFDTLVNPQYLSKKQMKNELKDLFKDKVKDIKNMANLSEEEKKGTSATGLLAAATGIGLTGAAAYGFKKSNKKPDDKVKEYTVEEYEKEAKKDGYNI